MDGLGIACGVAPSDERLRAAVELLWSRKRAAVHQVSIAGCDSDCFDANLSQAKVQQGCVTRAVVEIDRREFDQGLRIDG